MEYYDGESYVRPSKKFIGAPVAVYVCSAIISLVTAVSLLLLIFFAACECSNTTFNYCLCAKYTARSEDAQTCMPFYNQNRTKMTCETRLGYWTCHLQTAMCAIDNVGSNGWQNCTFTPSDTDNYPIATCDTFIDGRMICDNSSKACCWY